MLLQRIKCTAAFLAGVGLWFCAAGCSDPYAQTQQAAHLRQMEWAVDSASQREHRDAENLDTTFELFEGMGVPQGDMEKAMYEGMRLVN